MKEILKEISGACRAVELSSPAGEPGCADGVEVDHVVAALVDLLGDGLSVLALLVVDAADQVARGK